MCLFHCSCSEDSPRLCFSCYHMCGYHRRMQATTASDRVLFRPRSLVRIKVQTIFKSYLYIVFSWMVVEVLLWSVNHTPIQGSQFTCIVHMFKHAHTFKRHWPSGHFTFQSSKGKLLTHSLLQKGQDRSPPKAPLEELSFWFTYIHNLYLVATQVYFCNNFSFNGKHYLQTLGTVGSPTKSCSGRHIIQAFIVVRSVKRPCMYKAQSGSLSPQQASEFKMIRRSLSLVQIWIVTIPVR